MKITIKNLQKKIPITPAISQKIKKLILNTLSAEGIKKSGEITVCLLSNKDMKELNLLYLGKNQPTDVISFDISGDKKRILADIAVSIDTAISNSKVYKTCPIYELYLYIIHGVLHILGYDDQALKGKKLMQAKEKLYVHP